MAVAVYNHDKREFRSDSNYLRWLAYFAAETDGNFVEKAEEMHPCTEVDMAKFYPPENPA